MKEIGLNDLEMVSYDLALTIQNVCDYSRVIEWLTKCVAKRYRRGQLVDFSHLAGCSAGTLLAISHPLSYRMPSPK